MLKISDNKRYIIKDESPFLYLADAAWTIFQRLDKNEMLYYLDKRLSQGFNAVQVCCISEFDGVRKPNRYGELPFENADILKPNRKYFDLILWFLEECEKRDIVPVVLPTWGDKFNKMWGIGPEVFTKENSAQYGAFLGELFGKTENLIWMLGGDRPIDSEAHRQIIENMAGGIKSTERIEHLMTYHPCGERSSAEFFADAEFIDFHSVQSGHGFGGFYSERFIEETLMKSDKPCLDAECFYEDFPFDFSTEYGYRFSDLDVRTRIYKNMLSGSLGHTYGHQSVWCFREEPDEEYLFSWRQALDRPMANQMRHINELIKLIDIISLRPDKIAAGALSASGEGYSLIYIEAKARVFLRLERDAKKVLYFSPATGEIRKSEEILKKRTTLFGDSQSDQVLIIYY